jgi:hypothetical protein
VLPKNDIDFLKYLLGKISLLNHHIMKMEKKGKKVISPFFPHPRNNSLPLPIPFNKIILFF